MPRRTGVALCMLIVVLCMPAHVGRDEIARDYLDQAVRLVTRNAYYADRVTARQVSDIEASAERGALNPEDTYSGIHELLALLGDHHSTFVAPSEVPLMTHPGGAQLPTGAHLAGGIAYLRVPSIISLVADSRDSHEYASAAWSVISQNLGACGWIVDLRGNHGGTVFPMLAAVAPLLKGGPALGYTHRNGSTPWFGVYRDGIYADARPVQHFDGEIPSTGSSHIAVLVDGQTASAAEGVLIALLGAGAESFGAATAGVPTGNSIYRMPDGAFLIVTVAIGTSIDGTTYEGPIRPTFVVDPGPAAQVAAVASLQRDCS